MIGRDLSRSAGAMAALALVLAPFATAAATPCPDAATVQAARLVEFQTMMMGVSVRCKHVGVAISDHLDGMNSARRTVLGGANERVATFLRSVATPALKPASTPLAAPDPKKPAAGKPASAKLLSGKPAPAKPALGKAAAGKAALAAAPKPPAAKISRRTDPYDRYLTMIGNQYGAGITTLQRCKAFDAIVLSLSDRTNTDRLLTMVSSSLVEVTLLEAIVNCPPGK